MYFNTNVVGTLYAVDGADVEAARQQLQRLMRDAEADIAEALSNEGWLTVLDDPLHGIRHRRGLPVIGLREDAPPPHARPRTLGQSAGADGPGTVGPLRDGGRSLRLLPAGG